MPLSTPQRVSPSVGAQPNRRLTGKRLAKRELLLDEAARCINDQGAGSIALNEIAEQVGLSRNTLYYYVSDRDDLVFQCYLRCCMTTADDLAAAQEAAGGPADRIRHFIEAALTPDRRAMVALTDIDQLPEPKRSLVEEAQARNIAGVKALLDEGVSAGAFRPCDTQVAATVLYGSINWSRISSGWGGYRDSPAMRRRATRAISDLFLSGLAAPGVEAPRCSIEAKELVERPFNAFDRRQASAFKVNQLVAAASHLFNRRGIDAISLEDIAAELGATKGAIYHYFASKTDLVVRCYRRAFELWELFNDHAAQVGRNGLERLVIHSHLNVQSMVGPAPTLMTQPGRGALPPAEAAELAQASQRLTRAWDRHLRQGVADGSCRPVDFRFTGFAAAGMLLWLPRGQFGASSLGPMRLADEVTTLLALGVVQRPQTSPP